MFNLKVEPDPKTIVFLGKLESSLIVMQQSISIYLEDAREGKLRKYQKLQSLSRLIKALADIWS